MLLRGNAVQVRIEPVDETWAGIATIRHTIAINVGAVRESRTNIATVRYQIAIGVIGVIGVDASAEIMPGRTNLACLDLAAK